MKKRMICFKPRCIIIFAVMGMFLATCNMPDTSKQKHTVESFYRIIITGKFFEIPDSSHLGLIKPYISEHLQKLLIEARNAEDTIASKETEPVPPVIEGSLFSSLFEGPDSLTSIKADSSAPNVFLVELEYKNSTDTAGNKTTFRWSDRVHLIKENGTWVIDDIDLLGNWDFARKARVSSILKSVISMK
jgi:hypothetical protein